MPILSDTYTNLKSVNFNLTDTTRKLIKNRITTQQGIELLKYNFLLSANDCAIKNYTSNYLTFNLQEGDIIEDIRPIEINDSLNTSIYNIDSLYLAVSSNRLNDTSFAILTSQSLPNFIYDFTVDFTATSGSNTCTVWCYDGLSKKYLTIDESNDNSITFSQSLTTNFDYLFDNNTNTINLFYSLTSNNLVWLVSNNSILSVIIPDPLSAGFLNFYTDTQNTPTTIPTNYFALYTSGVDVNLSESIQDLKYNFLLNTPYETWSVKLSAIEGSINFFNLQNYKSRDGFINKLPPFTSKTQKNYNSIITSEYQEKTNEKLQLGFNFNNKEYLFKADKYTKFTLPDTLLPFTRININDSGLRDSGSFAGSSPYFSDRVYKLLDNNLNVNRFNESNGINLCSWLNTDGIWYDRYYLPSKTSYAEALTSQTAQVFNYVSELSSFISNNNIQTVNFYDIKSSLMFEPSATYYYARVGEKYIESVLSGKNSNLIKDSFNPYSFILNKNFVDSDSMILSQDLYDSLNLNLITSGRLNISFKYQTDNFNSSNAYQLIGNNYNLGFSLRKNFNFTPFIVLQEHNSVYFYDYNFNLIKKNTYDLTGVGNIQDICYTSQNTDIVLRTSNGFFKTDITGQILAENTIIDSSIKNDVNGRFFYGTGNRGYFITGNAPQTLFLTDLQTLDTQLSATSIIDSKSIIVTSQGKPVPLPGIKGVNFADIYGVCLSANQYILFTDLVTSNTFIGLSSDNVISDIYAIDSKLYIQNYNKITVVNTEREILSTISLSQSAVSGIKIDAVMVDGDVNILSFVRDINDTVIVEKISNTTGATVSTHTLDINLSGVGDWFINPTGLSFTKNTYKNYEDKLCFTLNPPNLFKAQQSNRIWGTYSRLWSETTPTAYWSFNYSADSILGDNSLIDVIPITNIEHHISIDLNLIDGVINIYVDGVLTNRIDTPTNLLAINSIIRNSLYIGVPNYADKSIIDYVTYKEFIAGGFNLSDLNIYDISLSDDFIKYLFLRGTRVDDINFDISCGARNSIETIDNYFKYNIPGRLSNSILIYIKGLDVDESTKQNIIKNLNERIQQTVPATISNVTYNFDVK